MNQGNPACIATVSNLLKENQRQHSLSCQFSIIYKLHKQIFLMSCSFYQPEINTLSFPLTFGSNICSTNKNFWVYQDACVLILNWLLHKALMSVEE